MACTSKGELASHAVENQRTLEAHCENDGVGVCEKGERALLAARLARQLRAGWWLGRSEPAKGAAPKDEHVALRARR